MKLIMSVLIMLIFSSLVIAETTVVFESEEDSSVTILLESEVLEDDLGVIDSEEIAPVITTEILVDTDVNTDDGTSYEGEEGEFHLDGGSDKVFYYDVTVCEGDSCNNQGTYAFATPSDKEKEVVIKGEPVILQNPVFFVTQSPVCSWVLVNDYIGFYAKPTNEKKFVIKTIVLEKLMGDTAIIHFDGINYSVKYGNETGIDLNNDGTKGLLLSRKESTQTNKAKLCFRSSYDSLDKEEPALEYEVESETEHESEEELEIISPLYPALVVLFAILVTLFFVTRKKK